MTSTPSIEVPPAKPGEVRNWLALRSLARSADIAHQNWKDARRLNGRAEKGEGKMEEDMKINSPETHHHYPQPPSPVTSLMKPLLGMATAAILGGSGVGAAYMVADAIRNKPVPPSVEDTDSTVIQQFDSQDADWLKNE